VFVPSTHEFVQREDSFFNHNSVDDWSHTMKSCSGHTAFRDWSSQLHERSGLPMYFIANTVYAFVRRQFLPFLLVGWSVAPFDLSLLIGSIRRVSDASG
jgi:hypothetical protein